MRKTSIEMVMLLSMVHSRKELADFLKDAKALGAEEVELLLKKLDEQKTGSLATLASALGAQLERRREISGTAAEISYLLLTRYKLKVPVAAERLVSSLATKGYEVVRLSGSSKKEFNAWLVGLCELFPRDKLMSATLDLQPQDAN
jgi:hypothetical protein